MLDSVYDHTKLPLIEGVTILLIDSRYSDQAQVMPEEKVLMYESPEAASIQSVTGWGAADGCFWDND